MLLLDWIAAFLGPAIVGQETTGGTKVVVFHADQLSDAYSANATRFLHGYFTGHSGALRFEFETEDASRHKIISASTEKSGVLEAMNSTAKRLDPAARPFSTSNEEALAAWGRGEFERAVTIDPDFGTAWLSWVESLAAHGQKAEAADVARRALDRSRSSGSDLDRAKIEAGLGHARRRCPAAREQALTKLTALEPNDTAAIANLEETELNARQFRAAAAAFQKILALDPENSGIMNSLGYAEAGAGDLDAARKTLEEYGKQAGQKANSLDSLGEAYFMNGRFADAEKYFLQAHEANPAFLAGDDLQKAAYAHWLAGDLKGADALMKRYLDLRANDPLRAWRDAAWLYSTGRREQAVAELQGMGGNQIATRQLAVWNAKLRQDVAPLKQAYQRTPPTSDGQVRTFYAAALVASGQKEEARKLLALWPLPAERGGDPLLDSLVFPTFIELRKAVGLPR